MPEEVSQIGVRLTLDASGFTGPMAGATKALGTFQAEAQRASAGVAQMRAGGGGGTHATGTPMGVDVTLAVSQAEIGRIRKQIMAGLGNIPVTITPQFAKSGNFSLPNILGSMLSMQYGTPKHQAVREAATFVERFVGQTLPQKAAGGPVAANRPVIVGERRPEVFVPRTGGVIVPSVMQYQKDQERLRRAEEAAMVYELRRQREHERRMGGMVRHGGGYAHASLGRVFSTALIRPFSSQARASGGPDLTEREMARINQIEQATLSRGLSIGRRMASLPRGDPFRDFDEDWTVRMAQVVREMGRQRHYPAVPRGYSADPTGHINRSIYGLYGRTHPGAAAGFGAGSYHQSSEQLLERWGEMEKDLLSASGHARRGQMENPWGFFHATTDINSVLKRGLMSSEELRHDPDLGYREGLGGGSTRVSLTWSLNRARQIAASLRMAGRAARGEAPPEQIANYFLKRHDPATGPAYSHEAALMSALTHGVGSWTGEAYDHLRQNPGTNLAGMLGAVKDKSGTHGYWEAFKALDYHAFGQYEGNARNRGVFFVGIDQQRASQYRTEDIGIVQAAMRRPRRGEDIPALRRETQQREFAGQAILPAEYEMRIPPELLTVIGRRGMGGYAHRAGGGGAKEWWLSQKQFHASSPELMRHWQAEWEKLGGNPDPDLAPKLGAIEHYKTRLGHFQQLQTDRPEMAGERLGLFKAFPGANLEELVRTFKYSLFGAGRSEESAPRMSSIHDMLKRLPSVPVEPMASIRAIADRARRLKGRSAMGFPTFAASTGREQRESTPMLTSTFFGSNEESFDSGLPTRAMGPEWEKFEAKLTDPFGFGTFSKNARGGRVRHAMSGLRLPKLGRRVTGTSITGADLYANDDYGIYGGTMIGDTLIGPRVNRDFAGPPTSATMLDPGIAYWMEHNPSSPEVRSLWRAMMDPRRIHIPGELSPFHQKYRKNAMGGHVKPISYGPGFAHAKNGLIMLPGGGSTTGRLPHLGRLPVSWTAYGHEITRAGVLPILRGYRKMGDIAAPDELARYAGNVWYQARRRFLLEEALKAGNLTTGRGFGPFLRSARSIIPVAAAASPGIGDEMAMSWAVEISKAVADQNRMARFMQLAQTDPGIAARYIKAANKSSKAIGYGPKEVPPEVIALHANVPGIGAGRSGWDGIAKAWKIAQGLVNWREAFATSPKVGPFARNTFGNEYLRTVDSHDLEIAGVADADVEKYRNVLKGTRAFPEGRPGIERAHLMEAARLAQEEHAEIWATTRRHQAGLWVPHFPLGRDRQRVDAALTGLIPPKGYRDKFDPETGLLLEKREPPGWIVDPVTKLLRRKAGGGFASSALQTAADWARDPFMAIMAYQAQQQQKQGRARGGSANEGMYIVGEIGPELFVPNTMKGMIPKKVMDQIPHAGGGMQIIGQKPNSLFAPSEDGIIIPNRLMSQVPHRVEGGESLAAAHDALARRIAEEAAAAGISARTFSFGGREHTIIPGGGAPPEETEDDPFKKLIAEARSEAREARRGGAGGAAAGAQSQLEAIRLERAGQGQLMGGRTATGAVANMMSFLFGGRQQFTREQHEFAIAGQRFNNVTRVMGDRIDTARLAIEKIGVSEEGTAESRAEAIAKQNATIASSEKVMTEETERFYKASEKGRATNAGALKNLGVIIASTTLYGKAMAAADVVLEQAAIPAAEKFADALMGYPTASNRFTSALADQTRAQGGNYRAALAATAVTSGMSTSTFEWAASVLQASTAVKVGAKAVTEFSEIFKATIGTGAPNGVFGGYGGIGGGGLLAEQMGGGPGIYEQLTGDIAAARGRTTGPDLGKALEAAIPAAIIGFLGGGPMTAIGAGLAAGALDIGGQVLMGPDVQTGGTPNPEREQYLKQYVNEAMGRAAQVGGEGAFSLVTRAAGTENPYKGKGLPKEIEQLGEQGYQIVNAAGNVETSFGGLVKAAEQLAKGLAIPDIGVWFNTVNRQLSAKFQMIDIQGAIERNLLIPTQFAMQRIQQPYMAPGAGVIPGAGLTKAQIAGLGGMPPGLSVPAGTTAGITDFLTGQGMNPALAKTAAGWFQDTKKLQHDREVEFDATVASNKATILAAPSAVTLTRTTAAAPTATPAPFVIPPTGMGKDKLFGTGDNNYIGAYPKPITPGTGTDKGRIYNEDGTSYKPGPGGPGEKVAAGNIPGFNQPGFRTPATTDYRPIPVKISDIDARVQVGGRGSVPEGAGIKIKPEKPVGIEANRPAYTTGAIGADITGPAKGAASANQAAADSYESLMNSARDGSEQIKTLQNSIAHLNATVRAAQWAETTRLATRNIDDLKGVIAGAHGGKGGSIFGNLEGQMYAIGRASQKLDLALEKRSIATSLAIAGFAAPGETGEERYARQKQAIAEAGIRKTKLGYAESLFTKSGEAWEIQAQRNLEDSQKAWDNAKLAFNAETAIGLAQGKIAVISDQIAEDLAKADTIYKEAIDKGSAGLQAVADYAATFGGDIADLSKTLVDNNDLLGKSSGGISQFLEAIGFTFTKNAKTGVTTVHTPNYTNDGGGSFDYGGGGNGGFSTPGGTPPQNVHTPGVGGTGVRGTTVARLTAGISGGAPGFAFNKNRPYTGDDASADPKSLHSGMDFTAKRGTPVHAIAAGTVSYAANEADNHAAAAAAHALNGGNTVNVDDPFGTYQYAHLNTILVRKGQYVSAGEVVGKVGNTGPGRRNLTGAGPHLHLGREEGGKWINPLTATSGRASGFLGSVGTPTHMTMGEAGTETVAILRNPRMAMLNMMGGGGGTNLTVQINGPVVRDDKDIHELARCVAVEVERILGRKGQLLGLRGPSV